MPKKIPSSNLKGIQVDFGKQLRNWLGRRHLKQSAFAASLEMTDSQLSRIINGKANLRLSTMLRIVSALKISLREFYSDRQASLIEQSYPDDFAAFRQLFLIGDTESLSDIRKALRHAIREAADRASPGERIDPAR